MASVDTRQNIIDLLLLVASLERHVEVMRQVLCNQIDFEPYAAFNRLDRRQKGFLVVEDLVEFMESNSCPASPALCRAVLKHFDNDFDDKLNYTEFLRMILPMDNPDLRTHVAQRPNYDIHTTEFLTYDIEYCLVRLIDREASIYRDLAKKKAELFEESEFDISSCRKVIDTAGSGTLNYENLEKFFKSNGFLPYEEEIVCLLRRVDKDDDGRVDISELLEFFNLIETNSDEREKLEQSRRTAAVSRRSEGGQASRGARDRGAATARLEDGERERSPSPSRERILRDSPYRRIAYASGSNLQYSSPRRQAADTGASQGNVTRRRQTGESASSKPPAQVEESKVEETQVKQEKSERVVERSERQVRSGQPAPNEKEALASKEEKQDQLQQQASRRGSERESRVTRGPATEEGKQLPVTKEEEENEAQEEKTVTTTRRTEREKATTSTVVATSSATRSRVTRGTLATSQVAEELPQAQGSSERRTRRVGSPSRLGSALLSPDTNRVARALKELAVLDRESEIVKQDLALRPDFCLLDAFRVIDQSGRSLVNATDLSNFLEDLGVRFTRDSLQLLMQRYDLDDDSRLRFSDFVDMVCPEQPEYRSLIDKRSPQGSPDAPVTSITIFSLETRRAIGNVFKALLANELRAEDVRLRLQSTVSLRIAFSEFDLDRDGYVSRQELRRGLEAAEQLVPEKEVTCLLERLDRDKDTRVSLVEWTTELTPRL